ncbi:SdpI family protein [Rhodococcus sp. NPDC055112]
MTTNDVPGALIDVAWVFTGLLLLLVVVCVAAGRGAIPVNSFVGIRIPALKRSEAAWRVGHAAAVMPGVTAFVIAGICSGIGLGAPVAYWGTIIAMVGGVIWVFVRAARAADVA